MNSNMPATTSDISSEIDFAIAAVLARIESGDSAGIR